LLSFPPYNTLAKQIWQLPLGNSQGAFPVEYYPSLLRDLTNYCMVGGRESFGENAEGAFPPVNFNVSKEM
jgi:hypothetical protein